MGKRSKKKAFGDRLENLKSYSLTEFKKRLVREGHSHQIGQAHFIQNGKTQLTIGQTRLALPAPAPPPTPANRMYRFGERHCFYSAILLVNCPITNGRYKCCFIRLLCHVTAILVNWKLKSF